MLTIPNHTSGSCRFSSRAIRGGRDGSRKLWNFAGRSHDGLCARARPRVPRRPAPAQRTDRGVAGRAGQDAPIRAPMQYPKECRLNREHIEPRHVTGRIAAFEHEVLHREFGSIRANDSEFACQRSNDRGAVNDTYWQCCESGARGNSRAMSDVGVLNTACLRNRPQVLREMMRA